MSSQTNKIVILDTDTIIASSIDRTAWNNLPAIKKLLVFKHMDAIRQIIQSHPL
jgi:hypothetical protein